MDLDLRNQILTLFEEKSEKYRLDDITYGSFNATFGFRHKFCAADIVYSTLSLMEQNFVPKGSIEHGNYTHKLHAYITIYTILFIVPLAYFKILLFRLGCKIFREKARS